MADTQISLPQIEDTPSDYKVADAAEYRLKAVYAEFTDNGASGDWLPTVTIYSDSQHIVANALDPNVKVTAGDDAEVSWFPGVKPSAASAGGAGAPDVLFMFGVGFAIPSVVGGFSGEMPYNHTNFQTVGTNIWSFNLDGAGHIVEVLSSAHGIYEAGCAFHFDAPSALTQESCVLNVFGTIPAAVQISPTVSIATATIYEGFVGLLTHFTSGTAQFSCQADFDRNTTGFFRGQYWWIKRWAI